jgi:hypothetical protein
VNALAKIFKWKKKSGHVSTKSSRILRTVEKIYTVRRFTWMFLDLKWGYVPVDPL